MTSEGEVKKGETEEGNQNAVFWSFPDFAFSEQETVVEKELIFDESYATGTGKEIAVKGVYIWYGRFRTLKSTPVRINLQAAHVQMIFTLEGGASYFREGFVKPFVRFRSQQHNMMLLPKNDLLMHWKPESTVEVFAINISTSFFFQNLPAGHPVYTHFEKGIEKALPAFMSQRHLPLTSRMMSLLFEIRNSTFENYYKSMFIKAKVIELMAMQFEQYEQMPAPDITVSWKESDKERMHHARRILSENPEKSWSIKELAHQVGTNEFSLKKCFKEVFGKPVFAYLHDLRMETSMELLQKPGYLISEIAQRAGYKNATHFTVAFKKYFGVLPKKIRIGALHLLHFCDYTYQLICEAAECGTVLEVI